jgi:hypothetical protein
VPRVLSAFLAAIVVAILVAFAVPPLLAHLAGQRVRQTTAARGLSADWRRLRMGWDGRMALTGLSLARQTSGDTVFAAESVTVTIDRWSLLFGRARPTGIAISEAIGRLPGGPAAEPDTLVPTADRRDRRTDPRRAERVRKAAQSLVRLALTPARRWPALTLRNVALSAPHDAETIWSGLRLDWLETRPEGDGIRLAGVGAIQGEHDLPFEVSLRYAGDDHVEGGVRVRFPEVGSGVSEFVLAVDGAVAQEPREGRVVVSDTTRVTLGKLPLRLGAEIDATGPRLRLDLEARGITERQVRESFPLEVLGPLAEVRVTGSWDYRLALTLDLSQPDSVRFSANVIPRGLALDPDRTRLQLLGLEQPFMARIHLPGGRVVERELSPLSPSFRPLHRIAPSLVAAVLANEDGAFFRHRGFNTEAVRAAIAENLKAGAYRRGAGTITMQLARNLYLGHERTMARKVREMVLAWILEHLTGVAKDRLLEIYLNIIEWGPEVHGATEAARYYFDRDPADLTVDESLFLATVVPSPSRWRVRFDSAGRLRAFEREQMHFIGRAMITKGWLLPEELPPADSLRVDLRGQARAVIHPDSTGAIDSVPADRGHGNASLVQPLSSG